MKPISFLIKLLGLLAYLSTSWIHAGESLEWRAGWHLPSP